MSSKLRIMVPVKRAIDFAVKPRVNSAKTGVETAGVKFSINPFDDIAVEEAVKIKEAKKGAVESIHVVSAGSSKAQEVLRQSLAKGCDTSTLIDVGDASVEPLTVAKMLAKLAEEDKSNLIILGKQAIDDDSNHTGQMLAGLLNWPQVTAASKVDINESTGEVTVEHEVDGGFETVSASLPMIITTDLRLNTPRYATLPNIMKAKKKPLKTVKPADLGVDIAGRLETVSVSEPPPRPAGIKVNSVDELIAKLKERGAL
ncbi:hypothetical protein CANCADRAFT_31354 [Tortispora caseinolytica NRRL Y-17796]|uniref:Probable electron transfer flavoprotein subunit beta n=1 Tax=Tortispora caseinolytica NRRL Y-17796 TaxID=767744 RepID=A0A1E4TF99_9ASCO|nr:hypothetical protein CANCADRAFT_31354 [Tortispora caseinolytica NRRL Y-17796]